MCRFWDPKEYPLLTVLCLCIIYASLVLQLLVPYILVICVYIYLEGSRRMGPLLYLLLCYSPCLTFVTDFHIVNIHGLCKHSLCKAGRLETSNHSKLCYCGEKRTMRETRGMRLKAVIFLGE